MALRYKTNDLIPPLITGNGALKSLDCTLCYKVVLFAAAKFRSQIESDLICSAVVGNHVLSFSSNRAFINLANGADMV